MIVKHPGVRLARRAFVRDLVIGAVGLAVVSCTPASAPTATQAPAAPKATSPATAAKPTAAPAASSPAAAAKPQPNRPKDLTTLKLALPSKNLVALPAYVADKYGYFKEENLKVDIEHFESNQTIVKGMVAGQIDLTYSDSSGVLAAISEGANLKVVGSWATRMHFIVSARKEITTLRDLYGKSVAISQAGSLPDVVMRKLFEVEKLDIKQVEIAPIGGSPARVAALASGKVAAAPFNVDEIELVEKDPNLHVIYFVYEKLPNFLRSAVSMMGKWVSEKPEVGEAFMRAAIRGTRFLFDNPAETKAMGAELLGKPAAEIEKIYGYYAGLPLWKPDATIEPGQIDYMQQINVEMGAQKEKLPFNRVADFMPTERALATLPKYEIKNKPPVPKPG